MYVLSDSYMFGIVATNDISGLMIIHPAEIASISLIVISPYPYGGIQILLPIKALK